MDNFHFIPPNVFLISEITTIEVVRVSFVFFLSPMLILLMRQLNLGGDVPFIKFN